MRNPAFHKLLEEIAALHDSKNADYATDADPLKNFRRSEAFGITPIRGIFVRMSDKWSRIENLSNGQVPKNESLRDSLIDNAIYSLLSVMLLDEHSTREKQQEVDAKAQDRSLRPCLGCKGIAGNGSGYCDSCWAASRVPGAYDLRTRSAGY